MTCKRSQDFLDGSSCFPKRLDLRAGRRQRGVSDRREELPTPRTDALTTSSGTSEVQSRLPHQFGDLRSAIQASLRRRSQRASLLSGGVGGGSDPGGHPCSQAPGPFVHGHSQPRGTSLCPPGLHGQGQLRSKPNSCRSLNPFTTNQAQSHTQPADEAVHACGVVTLPPTGADRPEETTGAPSRPGWGAGERRCVPKAMGHQTYAEKCYGASPSHTAVKASSGAHGANTTARNTCLTRSFPTRLHELTAALRRAMVIGPNKPE